MRKIVTLLLPFLILFSLPMMTYADISGRSIDKKAGQVLLVLLSKKATIHATNDPKVYKLTLENVNPHVLYFSDRPKRISGHIPTQNLVSQWKTGDFHKVAPNAVMEAIGFDQRSEELKKNDVRTYAIELKKPMYDLASHQLTFEIKALEGNKLALPSSGSSDYVAVFIDGVCLTCIGG